ncbi:MAG: integrase arm-type DNA-binding domain-containing protein, partial [Nitrosomonas sp.]
MKLTDTTIKAAKPKEKAYKLSDGGGLLLLVQPNSSKWWRYRYRFNGKEKSISLGVYPGVTLKKARDLRVTASDLLKQGIDPSRHRQEQKQIAAIAAGNSFETVARLWWNHWKHNKTERHANYTIRRLEADIFPALGREPVNEISIHTLLSAVKKIETRGAVDIAKRALTTCGQVFRYAIVNGLAERNPAADIKPEDALKPTKKKNHARLDEKDLPELLQKIDAYDGQLLTRLALKLMALTF